MIQGSWKVPEPFKTIRDPAGDLTLFFNYLERHSPELPELLVHARRDWAVQWKRLYTRVRGLQHFAERVATDHG